MSIEQVVSGNHGPLPTFDDRDSFQFGFSEAAIQRLGLLIAINDGTADKAMWYPTLQCSPGDVSRFYELGVADVGPLAETLMKNCTRVPWPTT